MFPAVYAVPEKAFLPAADSFAMKGPRPAQRLSRPDRERSAAARAFDFDLPCPRGGNRSAHEAGPECLHVPENADHDARGAPHKFLPAIEDKRDSETHTQGTGQGIFSDASEETS